MWLIIMKNKLVICNRGFFLFASGNRVSFQSKTIICDGHVCMCVLPLAGDIFHAKPFHLRVDCKPCVLQARCMWSYCEKGPVRASNSFQRGVIFNYTGTELFNPVQVRNLCSLSGCHPSLSLRNVTSFFNKGFFPELMCAPW